jgi:MFS family permease
MRHFCRDRAELPRSIAMSTSPEPNVSPITPAPVAEATHLRELSPQQRRGGLAAWLGWLFDGLDSYLYIMVATPFVTQLLHTKSLKSVQEHAAYIQAAFLIGWAIGGAVFGRIGDRFGRSRTISLTILTYALCTGLSSFAQTWEQLLVFRFLAALGIGGEWAAGSSLIAETWPRGWRHWASATLQSAYQCGLLLAILTTSFFAGAGNERWVFLVGAAPALLVFWIRRAIPEPDEWHAARLEARHKQPTIADLFRGPVFRTTVLTILVCSASLTTVWALIFWFPQQLRQLPDVKVMSKADQATYVVRATAMVNIIAIAGNFFAAAVARAWGYRKAVAVMFIGSFIFMMATYAVPHDHITILYWAPLAHFFVQGIFGLFPLYIPPLFPTLLRTTGAGFCYNIGRVVAAIGTLIFGIYAHVDNQARALVYVGCLYIPALVIAALIPEPSDPPPVNPQAASA